MRLTPKQRLGTSKFESGPERAIYAKTKPRDDEIQVRSVRSTPEEDLGTSKFESRANDLPENKNSGRRNSRPQHAIYFKTGLRDVEIRVRSLRLTPKQNLGGLLSTRCKLWAHVY